MVVRMTALPKEEAKTDSIGNAMFTVDNLGKVQDSCDFEKKKIGKGSGGFCRRGKELSDQALFER